MPFGGDGALLRGAHRLGARHLQAPVVVDVCGEVAVPVGTAGDKPVGVVGGGLGQGAAGGTLPTGDMRRFDDPVLGLEGIGTRSAQGIGDGGGAVVVVGQLNALGAIGVLGADRAALGIVGPGGVAVAVLVGDAGQRMREVGILVVIDARGIVGVVLRGVVRIAHRDQVVERIVGVTVDPTGRVDHPIETTLGVVAHLQRSAERPMDPIQGLWVVVSALGHGHIVTQAQCAPASIGNTNQPSGGIVILAHTVGVLELPAENRAVGVGEALEAGDHIRIADPAARGIQIEVGAVAVVPIDRRRGQTACGYRRDAPRVGVAPVTTHWRRLPMRTTGVTAGEFQRLGSRAHIVALGLQLVTEGGVNRVRSV